MCSTATLNSALEKKQLAKFVELLVHDYLQVKGFQAAGAKFAEECSKAAQEDDAGSADKKGSASVDEAGSWYCLADKLALPVNSQKAYHLLYRNRVRVVMTHI